MKVNNGSDMTSWVLGKRLTQMTPIRNFHESKGGFTCLGSAFTKSILALFSLSMNATNACLKLIIGYNYISKPYIYDQRDGLTNFANDEEMYEHCISNFIDEFGYAPFEGRPEEEHLLLMEAYRSVEETYHPDDLEENPSLSVVSEMY